MQKNHSLQFDFKFYLLMKYQVNNKKILSLRSASEQIFNPHKLYGPLDLSTHQCTLTHRGKSKHPHMCCMEDAQRMIVQNFPNFLV